SPTRTVSELASLATRNPGGPPPGSRTGGPAPGSEPTPQPRTVPPPLTSTLTPPMAGPPAPPSLPFPPAEAAPPPPHPGNPPAPPPPSETSCPLARMTTTDLWTLSKTWPTVCAPAGLDHQSRIPLIAIAMTTLRMPGSFTARRPLGCAADLGRRFAIVVGG